MSLSNVVLNFDGEANEVAVSSGWFKSLKIPLLKNQSNENLQQKVIHIYLFYFVLRLMIMFNYLSLGHRQRLAGFGMCLVLGISVNHVYGRILMNNYHCLIWNHHGSFHAKSTDCVRTHRTDSVDKN